MRIILLTRTYPPDSGAVGHLVKELGEALVGKGHVVTVVAAGGGQNAREVDDLRVVRVGSLPFSRQTHWRRALSYLSLYPALLFAAAHEQRPDVMITTTDPPLQAVLGWFLKLWFRCKLVHWCQDLYPEMAEEAGVLGKREAFANGLRWISTTALRKHDRVVSIGRCMTERLRERGLEQERIVEIQNWTDPQWIHPVPEAENEFWTREGLQGRFVVLYSGNLGLAHSFSEVLEAASLLQEQAPEVLFLFVGEGSRRLEVFEEVVARSLENVRFLPSQSWKQISENLSAGQLHLVTLRESMAGLVVPSKFYGGVAAGRPCLFVGPKNSEVARLIVEHQVGRVIGNHDPEALVSAILDYLKNEKQRQADGKRARALGEKSGIKDAVRRFEDIFA